MSSISKEDAKNMALLFFMDHLMQKNGRRTIHDLSCQFGARGFSEEMREAVGTTQEGLTDFLSQFPSLFVIDGDTVTMTGYGDLAAGGAKASPLMQTLSRDRDYEMEAVEFFEEKLHRFGPELQIKSLLGHRSQSAPEIRLVSGRHVKDFADFLASHPDHFVIDQDRVRLRFMPEPSAQGHLADIDEDGKPLSGAKAKQIALDFLRETVEESCGAGKENNAQSSPLPVDNLYRKFCDRFSHGLRQEVATNPKELLQFLKLNRHIFFIRSNKVSIVRNRPTHDTPNSNSLNGDTESPRTDDCSSDSSDIRPRCLPMLISDADQSELAEASDRKATTLIVKSLSAACSAVGELEQLGDSIGVDAKYVQVSDRRFLSLLAVSSADCRRIYIFDVAHSASLLIESGFKDMLEADRVVKVMHDGLNLVTLLRQQYEIHIRNVFDTQIANTILQHQRTGKPLNEIKPISFLTLQRLYHPQSLMFTDSNITNQRSVKDWSARPLTKQMVTQCVDEVRFLMPFIYDSMHTALRPDFRSLFNHMCGNEGIMSNGLDNNRRAVHYNDSAWPSVALIQANGKSNRPENSFSNHNNNRSGFSSQAQNGAFMPCCACRCHKSFASGNETSTKKSVMRDAAVQTVTTI